jgi:hypothetical protein
MSDNDDTGSVGLTRIGYVLAKPLTEQQIQQGIARTMKDVVHDRYQPAIRPPAQTVRVVGAAQARDPFEPEKPIDRSGWREARPLTISPMGAFADEVVGRMIDAQLGPVFPNKAEAKAASKPQAVPEAEPKLDEPLKRRRIE